MFVRSMLKRPLISRFAQTGVGRVVDSAVGDLLAVKPNAKLSLGGKMAGAALLRVATRSVPGAILVGGGLLARAVHKKRKEKRIAEAVAASNAEEVARAARKAPKHRP